MIFTFDNNYDIINLVLRNGVLLWPSKKLKKELMIY